MNAQEAKGISQNAQENSLEYIISKIKAEAESGKSELRWLRPMADPVQKELTILGYIVEKRPSKNTFNIYW